VDPLDPDQLCAAVNERLSSLPVTLAETDEGPTITVADGSPVRFPEAAGGGVHGGSAPWIRQRHADGAVHEPGLVAALLVLAEQRPSIRTILDVGALYGYVSLLARSLFEHTEVHAFEANPHSYAALRHNVEANRPLFGDSVRAHHCALSEASEPGATLRIHRMSVADAAAGDGARGQEHRVDVWSLDDFCGEHALEPDLVKIDVEGFQARIVPGAREVVARSRPLILLEFDAPGAANDFGVPNRDVVRPLLEDGYRLLWGDHRSSDAGFRVLGPEDLTDQHEVNSLGILVP
jgi:FkbM family methyltransferase